MSESIACRNGCVAADLRSQLTAAQEKERLNEAFRLVTLQRVSAMEAVVSTARQLANANASGILHQASGIWKDLAADLDALEKETP